MDEEVVLGDLMPAGSTPRTLTEARGFRIAPPEPDEWTYDPTGWARPAPPGPAILPIARLENAMGRVGQVAWLPLAAAGLMASRLAEGAAQAATFPQRVMQGDYGLDPTQWSRNPEFIGEALNVTGVLSGGFLRPASSGAGSPPGRIHATNSPSSAPSLYDPPPLPLRDFADDYPNGAIADETGRLLVDRNGRSIHPDATLVGRRVLGEGTGGPSAPRRIQFEAPSLAELDALGTRLTGESPASFRRSRGEALAGYFRPEFDDLGYTGRGIIALADDLTGAALRRRTAHEVAHAVDFSAAPAATPVAFNARQFGVRPEDPDMEIDDQLHRIYRDLNNPPDGPSSTWAPADLGYEKSDWQAELWAEAFRAYPTDPNYINQAAPKVAQAIRDHVNTNPALSKVIHFNAGGIPVVQPLPSTIGRGVALPGGFPVMPLPTLVGNAMATVRLPSPTPPLGPQWGADWQAAYGDPNSPQFAARVAAERANTEAWAAEQERLDWERAVSEGRGA